MLRPHPAHSSHRRRRGHLQPSEKSNYQPDAFREIFWRRRYIVNSFMEGHIKGKPSTKTNGDFSRVFSSWRVTRTQEPIRLESESIWVISLIMQHRPLRLSIPVITDEGWNVPYVRPQDGALRNVKISIIIVLYHLVR